MSGGTDAEIIYRRRRVYTQGGIKVRTLTWAVHYSILVVTCNKPMGWSQIRDFRLANADINIGHAGCFCLGVDNGMGRPSLIQ